MSNQKEQEWEEEFDKNLYPWKHKDENRGEEIKDFIRQLLQSERAKTLEETRKIVWEAANKYPNLPLEERGDTWHEILRMRDEILEKLKTLK